MDPIIIWNIKTEASAASTLMQGTGTLQGTNPKQKSSHGGTPYFFREG
jgi:hypothetical protein